MIVFVVMASMTDIGNKYYFIAFQASINHERQPVSNVLVKGTHSLVWASKFKAIPTYLLFWEEVPEHIAIDIKQKNTINCEF